MEANQNKKKFVRNSINNRNQTLLRSSHTALLIVDVQQKLIPTIINKIELNKRIKKLINVFQILKFKIFHTEQNPDKLGSTIEELENILENRPFLKMAFSCAKCDDLMAVFNENGIKNIVICGIESHICILQTALELIGDGFNVYIPVDAISSRNTIDHDTALIRLTNSGAILTSTESIIFEICQTAARNEFKSISRIIKE